MDKKLIESLDAKLWRLGQLVMKLLPLKLGNEMPIMEAREMLSVVEEGLAELGEHIGAPGQEPRQVVRSGAWLGELEAALTHAQHAMTGLAQENHPGFAAVQIARDGLRSVIDSERRHSPNYDSQRNWKSFHSNQGQPSPSNSRATRS